MGELIRVVSHTDADDILAIYAPIVRDTTISFEVDTPSREEMQKRILLSTLPWLVLETDQKVRAYAYASPHRSRIAYQWSVDVSVYVDSQAYRRGYGRRLYQTLFGILRAQGYYTAYAGIALPNEASVRLHEAVGFRMIGMYRNVGYKLGRWRDVGWWELALRHYDQLPKPPRNFKELEGSTELQQLLTAPVRE
jgi:L-amino acid N-acyltransferase YncA